MRLVHQLCELLQPGAYLRCGLLMVDMHYGTAPQGLRTHFVVHGRQAAGASTVGHRSVDVMLTSVDVTLTQCAKKFAAQALKIAH